MNKTLTTVAAASLLLMGAAATASAQQSTTPRDSTGAPTMMNKDGMKKDGMSSSSSTQAPSGLATEVLPGKDVYDQKGDKVAAVKTVVPGKAGTPDQVVLTVGSILGIGGTDVRVPIDELHQDAKGQLVVAITEDQLKRYPPAEKY